ncbi:MAG: hypothetical protein HQ507_04780 [Candidatus Marinimicrobia bacterium]|nr:hypothetical protein [Candidatus Neomarinimicrobiota bacterium]
MRSQIIFTALLIFSLIQCEQTPTTLDEIAYTGDSGETPFSASISAFEFDFLSQQFFFSVLATSPSTDLAINAELLVSGQVMASLVLNDLGNAGDIQINDHSFDANWRLPDSLATLFDTLWVLNISASSNAETKTLTRSLQPLRPAAPNILHVLHLDTLTLASAALVLDTLRVTVSHSQGLDEIRNVSMMSLKPDGEYANNGQPIPLYDDGGDVVFFTFGGIDFTSGDSIANDGVYSLLLALSPTNLSGTYLWTFNARTWLGIEATPLTDSLIVLPAPSLVKLSSNAPEMLGVFE